MKKSVIYLFILTCLTPLFCNAYIPQIGMIFDRTVKNHGNSAYIIDAEVTVDSRGQIFLAKETWLIEDAETMRVRVAGEKDIKSTLSLIRIYKNGKRYSLDDNKTFKAYALPQEFLEPLFYIRTVKKLERTLMDLTIIPPSYSRGSKPIKDLEEPSYNTPNFLRLSRVGGVPAFFIGQPIPMGPAVWIEQDQFLIRRIRLSNQLDIFADEYQKYANSIMLPQSRTIKWGTGYQGKIRIVNVRTVALSPKIKELFTSKSLLEEREKKESIDSVPEDPILKDFYTRFR